MSRITLHVLLITLHLLFISLHLLYIYLHLLLIKLSCDTLLPLHNFSQDIPNSLPSGNIFFRPPGQVERQIVINYYLFTFYILNAGTDKL